MCALHELTRKRRFGLLRKRLTLNGAPSRSRTGTSFRTTDFKSGVSTNFTIRAIVQISLRPYSHEADKSWEYIHPYAVKQAENALIRGKNRLHPEIKKLCKS